MHFLADIVRSTVELFPAKNSALEASPMATVATTSAALLSKSTMIHLRLPIFILNPLS